MDMYEALEFSREYKPPVIYVISKIVKKGAISNYLLHDEMINQPAYPLFLEVGKRGWIMCKPEYDNRFHRIHTSQIIAFTPWSGGEDTVVIETENTIYTLSKQ